MGRLFPLYDVEVLKRAALARLHDGEAEHMPTLSQIRERVFLDLAQNGVAIYACPDHPLAAPELRVVLHEVETEGWNGAYELLPALADTYPLHILIVCAASLTGPAYTLHGNLQPGRTLSSQTLHSHTLSSQTLHSQTLHRGAGYFTHHQAG